MSRLTNKELLDIRTMRYFIPNNLKGWRIRQPDKKKMADLSSRGMTPQRVTAGFRLLRWGKTCRDLQITYWREDITAGLTTKDEILRQLPEWLRPIILDSLRGAFMEDAAIAWRIARYRA